MKLSHVSPLSSIIRARERRRRRRRRKRRRRRRRRRRRWHLFFFESRNFVPPIPVSLRLPFDGSGEVTKEDEGGGERANGSRKKVFRCSLARIDFLLPLPLPQLLPPLAREFYPTRVPCITLMSGHGVNARGGRERKRIPFSCVHRVRERERGRLLRGSRDTSAAFHKR